MIFLIAKNNNLSLRYSVLNKLLLSIKLATLNKYLQKLIWDIIVYSMLVVLFILVSKQLVSAISSNIFVHYFECYPNGLTA
jgi:hypothetical protein